MPYKKMIITLITVFLLISTAVFAKSDLSKQFNNYYNALDADMMNHDAEHFTISDFTYTKDLANIHFKSGDLYMLRYINDRPTTALFIGEGSVDIKIPSVAERNALEAVSGKDSVAETFKVCIIRFADDFDLAVKEKFTPDILQISWNVFNTIKEEQADFFFKPIINHTYDNCFEQTRSIYERNAKGLFWIDFNRYNFLYDPNRPFPVEVGYEFEPNDFAMTYPVALPADVTTELTNLELSTANYQTTPLGYTADIYLTGLDGQRIESAQADMQIVVDADSLRFVNTFLHYNLSIDSIYVNGKEVDYHRRNDFKFVGLILPEYVKKGDTLTITYWYDGKNYDYLLPYVDNRIPVEHSFTFHVQKGYNYIMPGMGEITKDGKFEKFNVELQQLYKTFYYQGMATNFDTVHYTSNLGIPVNIIKSKAITKQVECYVPDAIYDSSIMNAFNFMTSKVGAPIGTFNINVYPDGFSSMPGMVQVPQVLCYEPGYTNALGGFNIFTGHSMAKQWFGNLMQTKTERENWLEYAAPEYLSLMFIQSLDDKAFYSNLALRRDSLEKYESRNMLRPIYLGSRATDINLTNKGVWLMHMLRILMVDLETGSPDNFNKFFHRLCLLTNNKIFTNEDIVNLAEQYHGENLGWFFDQWVFDYKKPHFDVSYSVQSGGEKYFVDMNIETSKAGDNFKYPIVFSFSGSDGNQVLKREVITQEHTSIKFGPFDFEPKNVVFNELFSVLCSESVKKK